MAEKLKSLTLTKSKLADIDGEHRVTFIASSPNEDRDYEKVDIKSFRLPIKGGGHIIVQDLPIDGYEEIDVPLLLDHDLYAVEKVIGSVRKAYYVDGNLVFEAGISSRPLAQEMFTLLNEGHLDNAFSIQYRDFIHDTATNTDLGGEIIEVSLVTRGSNMDASVLAVKSLKEKGEQVENTETTPEVVDNEVKDEAVVETVEETKVEDEVAEAETESTVEEAEEVAEEKSEAEPVEETKEEVEAEEAEAETEVDNNTNEEKEENAMETVAKSLVVEKANQAKTASADYLKTKSAMTDFRDIIVKMKGQDSSAIMKAWANQLKEKGITGDAILPSQIENIFFKTWYDETSPLSTFRTIRSSASAMNAFTGEGEGIRAKGHKKGEAKADQEIENLRRDLKAKIIYKKLPIDLQDLIDDQTGELTAFRAQELAERVLGEIVRGAVTGDGRSAGTPDYRVFDGTRGLFSMAADLNVAATPLGEEATSAQKYAHAVATVVENDADDNLYDKIVKTLAQIRDKGYGKSIALGEGAISQLKLLKGQDGHYIFQPGASVEDGIEARVFEIESIDGSGYDVIGWANQGYGIYAGDEMVRTAFDTTYNQDIMLVERAAAGSLYGYRSCAGYASATTTA